MTIAFIGSGNMASAIVNGLVHSGVAPDTITVADPNESQRRKVGDAVGVNTTANNAEAVADADTVLLAVKPDRVVAVCMDIASTLKPDALTISIAAGVTLDTIANALGENRQIVRCMPNTPALLGTGATALFANRHCSETARATATELLSAVGKTAWVDSEDAINAITALSGSGPAYIFQLVKHMADAAVAQGLPAEIANTFAIETAFGAASMLRLGEDDPQQLTDNVTSKGGTTAAALKTFNDGDFAGLVARAMRAANDRSVELAAAASE